MTEYKREFVQLSKYAQEIVPIEVDLCTHFECDQNEEIHMLVGAFELKEFIILSKRAQKMEDICSKKKKVDLKP